MTQTRYRTVSVYRPRWWYWMAMGVAGLPISFVLWMLFGTAAWLTPFGVAFATSRFDTIGLSSAGITRHGRTRPWDTLRLDTSRFGTVIRAEPAEGVAGVQIVLGKYCSHWRIGSLGDDLRRWAPSLLDPAA